MRCGAALFAYMILFPLLAWAADGREGTEPLRLFSFSTVIHEPPVRCFSNPSPGTPAAAATAGTVQNPRPMTDREKLRFYLKNVYGPQAFAYSVAGAGIAQARDDVPEWGQGMEGYGKRLALRVGRRSIKYSIHSGLGILLHEDPRYFTSNRSGFRARSLYAAGQTFVSHKDSGGIRPAYSRFVGIVSATYISREWRPQADQTFSQYAYSSAIWLGIDAAKNVFNEFWPDLRRRFRR